jgi:hypothetical protein
VTASGGPTLPASTAIVHAAGAIALIAWSALAWRSHHDTTPLTFTLATIAVSWTALGAAAWVAQSARSRDILLWAIAFRGAAFFAEPVMEDDHHRFLWDGYRFATTGNPYSEAPAAQFDDPTIPIEFREILDRVNHPDVPTIYGPVCQWAFRLSYAIAPGQLWPWKLILLGSEIALLWLLWPRLETRGRLLLAWCPLAVFETGFNAHPDTLAIALLIAALCAARRQQATLAAVTIGLAVAAKIFAVLLVPFVLLPLGRRAWLIAGGCVALLYAPFWLNGSAADVGGLHVMAQHWEFNSILYALAAIVFTAPTARIVCALLFLIVWGVAFERWRSRSLAANDIPPGDVVYGGFLLLSATANPWYCLWLWPFVAARISATGVGALVVVSVAYVTGLNLGDPSLGNFEHPAWVRVFEGGVIAAALAWDASRARLRRVSDPLRAGRRPIRLTTARSTEG